MLSAIFISVISAAIFASLLMYVFKRRGPGPGSGLLFLFLILFVFSWVGGTYIIPSGPVEWGASWLAYAGVAFFIMLLLATVLPPSSQRPRPVKQNTEAEVQAAFSVSFGIFFWILIITLLILAVTGAFYNGEPKVIDTPENFWP